MSLLNQTGSCIVKVIMQGLPPNLFLYLLGTMNDFKSSRVVWGYFILPSLKTVLTVDAGPQL